MLLWCLKLQNIEIAPKIFSNFSYMLLCKVRVIEIHRLIYFSQQRRYLICCVNYFGTILHRVHQKSDSSPITEIIRDFGKRCNTCSKNSKEANFDSIILGLGEKHREVAGRVNFKFSNEKVGFVICWWKGLFKTMNKCYINLIAISSS